MTKLAKFITVLGLVATTIVLAEAPLFYEEAYTSREVTVTTNASPTLITTNIVNKIRGVFLVSNPTNAVASIGLYYKTNDTVPFVTLQAGQTYKQTFPTPALGDRFAKSLGTGSVSIVVAETWGR